MKILVINCGSSTIKYQLYDMEKSIVMAKGRCDKIGLDSSNMLYKNLIKNVGLNEVPTKMENHEEAVRELVKVLTDNEIGVIKSFDEVAAVGHRVVQGGDIFKEAALINEDVINKIDMLSEFAPLHNPGALMGINAMISINKNMVNVAVFDTAFHQTIPEYNYRYAIKDEYYDKYKIRKYGAHGTSYQYILNRLEELLNKPKDKINAVVCHLGGGASVCAIKNGKSYDTSMGFTPLEGLMMETRCGDIDAAAVTKIMEKENLSPREMENILNKECGRLGVCSIPDERLLIEAAKNGNEKAELARKMQTTRTKKYIGAYLAELNLADAIVFTGGVGENNPCERQRTLENMENLGIVLDESRNNVARKEETLISSDVSKVKVYMIPTDEEFEIAKETNEIYLKVKGM